MIAGRGSGEGSPFRVWRLLRGWAIAARWRMGWTCGDGDFRRGAHLVSEVSAGFRAGRGVGSLGAGVVSGGRVGGGRGILCGGEDSGSKQVLERAGDETVDVADMLDLACRFGLDAKAAKE